MSEGTVVAANAAVWARRAPVALATVLALIHAQNGPGLFVPDTINFLGEGLVVGDGGAYPLIPPAFPAILDLVCFCVPAPARMFVLVVLQQLAAVATVWCSVRVAETAGRPWLTAGVGLVIATYAPLYAFALTSQSESFYIAFAAAACWFAVRGWTHDRTRDFAWAGLWTGLAIAQRTVGFAIPAAVVLALLIGRMARRWRRAALFLAAMLVVLGCFVAKNALHHGHATLVGGTGLHLFGRVAMVDRWLPDTPEARRIREVSAKHGAPDPLFQNAGWRLQAWLQWGEGMAPEAADALLRTVALQVHLGDPLRSVALTFREMASMVRVADPMQHLLWGGLRPAGFAAHNKGTDDTWKDFAARRDEVRAQLAPYPGQPRLGERVYDAMEWLGRWSVLPRGVWVIPAMMLAWAIGALRRDPMVLLTAGLPFAQIFATAVGDQPYERYWDPCVPAFVLGVALAAHAALRWWRERPPHAGERAPVAAARPVDADVDADAVAGPQGADWSPGAAAAPRAPAVPAG